MLEIKIIPNENAEGKTDMLNKSQILFLHDSIKFQLDAINELENPLDALEAFEAILAKKLTVEEIRHFDLLEVWPSIKQIRDIFDPSCPCPQNIIAGSPYLGLGPDGVKDGIVYFEPLGHGHGIVKEQQGLLNLTGREDALLEIKRRNREGTMPNLVEIKNIIKRDKNDGYFIIKHQATKKDVTDYIEKVLQEYIEPLQQKVLANASLLKQYLKNLNKKDFYRFYLNQAKSDPEIGIAIFSEPVLRNKLSNLASQNIIESNVKIGMALYKKGPVFLNTLNEYLLASIGIVTAKDNPEIIVNLLSHQKLLKETSFHGYMIGKYPEIALGLYAKGHEFLAQFEGTTLCRICRAMAKDNHEMSADILSISILRNKISSEGQINIIKSNINIAKILYDKGTDFLLGLQAIVLDNLLACYTGSPESCVAILTTQALRNKINNARKEDLYTKAKELLEIKKPLPQNHLMPVDSSQKLSNLSLFNKMKRPLAGEDSAICIKKSHIIPRNH